MDRNIIKVLAGQRRVGKSCVLLEYVEFVKLQKENANIIYIDAEDLAFSHIKTDSDKTLWKYLTFGVFCNTHLMYKVERAKIDFVCRNRDPKNYQKVTLAESSICTCEIFLLTEEL